jgi:hypothetical protein
MDVEEDSEISEIGLIDIIIIEIKDSTNRDNMDLNREEEDLDLEEETGIKRSDNVCSFKFLLLNEDRIEIIKFKC